VDVNKSSQVCPRQATESHEMISDGAIFMAGTVSCIQHVSCNTKDAHMDAKVGIATSNSSSATLKAQKLECSTFEITSTFNI
jgi:hypothetical protein